MNILITGGAGFIGSHLAEKLLASGHKVLVIDNYETGRRDNLSPQRDLSVVEGTIVDGPLVDKLFNEFRPDQVVHAAASYKDPDNWLEDAMTNVVGTINVVRAAKNSNVKRIIYFHTALCYGLTPLEQPITLKHPLFSGGYPGGSSYAISKTGGEQYIELSGLDFVSFRLANGYGPRNISGPLPTFYQRLTTGKQCFVMDTRRDFVYVDDIVDAVIKALNGMGSRGYYNISSGTDCSIKELFDATLKALNIKLEKDVEIRPRGPDDVYSILLDPSKTKQDFNWQATTSLEDGVRKGIEWYRTHEINQTFTHLKPVDAKK
jgi:UDP-glucose 4-epimerase